MRAVGLQSASGTLQWCAVIAGYGCKQLKKEGSVDVCICIDSRSMSRADKFSVRVFFTGSCQCFALSASRRAGAVVCMWPGEHRGSRVEVVAGYP